MLYGGMDWSGTTDRNGKIPLYVPCVVALQDVEALHELFAALRRKFGMKQSEEFHGSEATGEKLAAVLNVGVQLDFRVGALLIDKTISPVIPDSNAAFVTLSAQRLLQLFIPRHPLERLWCDEEDLNKNAAQKFKNDISAIGRQYGVNNLKASIYPSHQSDLIQLADVTAYALSWDARKRSEKEVETALRAMRKNADNVIVGPTKWD